MIKIAICDDDKADILKLTKIIDEYNTEKNMICTYDTFSNAFNFVDIAKEKLDYDIYCLDILMPGFTGIDIAKEIRKFDKNAVIIFCTSSPEFAVSSYSVKAEAYLLKPIDKSALFEELDEIINRLNKNNSDYLVVKSLVGIEKINISDIIYVEVSGRNVIYHLHLGEVNTSDIFSTISEKLLQNPNFIKAHRSFLINFDSVKSIIDTEIKFYNETSIFLSKRKISKLKQAFLKYQIEM